MIREINIHEMPEMAERLAAIHLASFDDKRSSRQLKEDIIKYSQMPGFRCIISEQAGINGYVFGYKSSGEQFYRGLIDQHLSEDERHRLDESFEVVSMAIDRYHRHNGIGTQLIQALVKEPGHYYLTADVHDIRANSFYFKNDWQLVKNNLHLHPNIAPKNLYYYTTSA